MLRNSLHPLFLDASLRHNTFIRAYALYEYQSKNKVTMRVRLLLSCNKNIPELTVLQFHYFSVPKPPNREINQSYDGISYSTP